MCDFDMIKYIKLCMKKCGKERVREALRLWLKSPVDLCVFSCKQIICSVGAQNWGLKSGFGWRITARLHVCSLWVVSRAGCWVYQNQEVVLPQWLGLPRGSVDQKERAAAHGVRTPRWKPWERYLSGQTFFKQLPKVTFRWYEIKLS